MTDRGDLQTERREVHETRGLMEALIQELNLVEGELYTPRRGVLKHIRRADEDDEEGLRRVKIMIEAFDEAYALARNLRKSMKGYRPDTALVISGLVMFAVRQPDAPSAVQRYLSELFTPVASAADSQESTTSLTQP